MCPRSYGGGRGSEGTEVVVAWEEDCLATAGAGKRGCKAGHRTRLVLGCCVLGHRRTAHHRRGPAERGGELPHGRKREQGLDAPRWAGRESGGCRTARGDHRGRGTTRGRRVMSAEETGRVHLGVLSWIHKQLQDERPCRPFGWPCRVGVRPRAWSGGVQSSWPGRPV